MRSTRPPRCPACTSAHVSYHSRYHRQLRDLPWQGRQVQLCLHTRRFRCRNGACRRHIFAERLPGVAVAMQSTGVYWIPLYEILDRRGFDVYLVNARHTRTLPGRKSDVQESQWLLKLHTYGLLSNSFHATADIRMLRIYWRQRNDHVQAVSMCIQRMQKVLTQ